MTTLYIGGFFVLFGLLMASMAYKQYGRKRRIESTTRTPAADVDSGLVQVEGRAVPIDPVEDPLYGEEAVIVDWDLKNRIGRGQKDDRVLSGRERPVFAVEDESGRVRVDPVGADVSVRAENATREQFRADDPEIARLRERTDSAPGRQSDDARWYDRRIVRPGEEVFVFGTATHDEDGTVVGMAPADTSGVVVGGSETVVVSTGGEPAVTANFGANTRLLAAIAFATTAIGAYVVLLGA